MEKKKIRVTDLGLRSYQEAYGYQCRAVQSVIEGGGPQLFFCEHPPILTLGRLADERFLLFSRETLREKGVEVADIDRGGEVTLHAPGQQVVYPVMDLKAYGRDLHEYMRKLEQAGIDLLRDFDIVARRNTGKTGVWVADQKIISLGIGVRKWVVYHGMAININTEMSLFSLIKPCGLDVTMTSLKQLLGRPVDMALVREKCAAHFCRIFDLDLTF